MTLAVHFTLPVPEFDAEIVDGDVWAEDEPPELPEPGGTLDEPTPPEPRPLPQSVPDVTYWGLLDESGAEITAGGYARVEITESTSVWEYDDEAASDALTNAVDLTGITPSGTWPTVARAAVWNATGAVISSAPVPHGFTPTTSVPITLPSRELRLEVIPDQIIMRYSETMPAADVEDT